MPSVSIDDDAVLISAHSGPALVGPMAFGSIYTTFLTLGSYAAATPGSVTGLRWPGGTMAENDPDRYDLRLPDIYADPAPGDPDYDPLRQKGLTEVMAHAVANGLAFSMIIPTRRYIDDVAAGQRDLRAFLERLLDGDFGPLPEDFTLEIGNETSHLGWTDGVFDATRSYGNLANAMLQTVREVLAGAAVDIDVAIQLGTTTGGTRSILDQISAANLGTVDGFVRHAGLVATAGAFDVPDANAILAVARGYWEGAFAPGAAPSLPVLDTAWWVGGSSRVEDVADPAAIDVGARQAGAVIGLFGRLIASGSDGASIWGVQDSASSGFWHDGETMTHGGHAFRLMAESLAGTRLLAGNLDATGDWQSRGATHDVVAYRDGAKIVVFMTAGDIGANGLDVTVDLSGFGPLGYAWGEVISTLRTGTGGPGAADDRFHEEAVISRTGIAATGGGFTFHFDEDFQVVRVILSREAPGTGYLHLWGTAAANVLTGGNSSDLLEGNGGADTVRGGSGRDTITGGSGSDSLIGDAGNDHMTGGAGNDVYRVDSTGDVIVEVTGSGSGTDLVQSEIALSLGDLDAAVENLTLLGTVARGVGNGLGNALRGNAAANTLSGAAGDDTIFGMAGDDRLVGGAGADVFVLSGASPGIDTIADFNALDGGAAEGDILRFDGLLVGTFVYRGGAGFTGGGNNTEARVAGDRVLVDADGDGVADLRVALEGLVTPNQLTAGDFAFT